MICRLFKKPNQPFQKGYAMRTLLCVLALGWATVANANFEDAVQATCRITNPAGQMGTGVVTTVTGDYVGVLTNAHVVGNHQTVKCEFYRQGYQSQPVEATVAARASTEAVDAALVAIRASVFGDMAPKPIKLASASYVVKPGETIMSVGCAKGTWPTAWVGHAKGYFGPHLLFNPPPANGRSGSALFNEAGDIVGLIFARSNDDSVGLACSIQAMHTELAADCKRQGDRFTYTGQTSLVSWTPVQQCPDGKCGPNGQCTPDLFKGRKQKQGQQQTPPQSSPWPGFGGGQPTPATPSVDLTPLAEELKKIAKNTEPKSEAVPPVPEKPAGPDPAIQQAIGQNAADIKALAAAVPAVVEKQIEPIRKDVADVKDVLTVRLKAKEVVDKVTGRDDGDPFLDSKFVRYAGGIFGVLALVVFGVMLVMRTGRGVIGTVYHRAAERHPDNEFLQRRDEFWTGVGGKAQAAIGKTRIGKRIAARVADTEEDEPVAQPVAPEAPSESTTT